MYFLSFEERLTAFCDGSMLNNNGSEILYPQNMIDINSRSTARKISTTGCHRRGISEQKPDMTRAKDELNSSIGRVTQRVAADRKT